MFEIDNLPTEKKEEVRALFEANNYEPIGVIFLEYKVATCPECAGNFIAIKEWFSYWIKVGVL